MRKLFLFVSVVFLFGFMIGCSSKTVDQSQASPSGKSGEPTSTKSPEPSRKPEEAKPVTLKIAVAYNNFPEEQLKQFLIDPVKKKYPNITIETINGRALRI